MHECWFDNLRIVRDSLLFPWKIILSMGEGVSVYFLYQYCFTYTYLLPLASKNI